MKTKWEDLTIGDHIQIQEISKLQLATDDEKNLKVAAIIAEMSYDDLLQLPFNKLREIMDNTEFLLHKPKPAKTRKKYTINDHNYILFKDPSEMTVAQYIDFQQIYKDGFEKMPCELLSIFLVPEGHQYNDGYDKDQQLEDMKSLSVTEALGICDFFIGRCHRLMSSMMMFSKMMLKWRRIVAPKEMKPMIREIEMKLEKIAEESEELLGLTLFRQ